jgi:hypothetical protein
MPIGIMGRNIDFLGTPNFLLRTGNGIAWTALSRSILLFPGRNVELFRMPFHGTYTSFRQEGKLDLENWEAATFSGLDPLPYLSTQSSYIIEQIPQPNHFNPKYQYPSTRVGVRRRIWLTHYATSRKIVGSIPDEVGGFFNWHNPSSHTTFLGSSQPLTKTSNRNLPQCKGWPECKANNLTTICKPSV